MRREPPSIRWMVSAGLTRDDAIAVRRISMALRRWYEAECGDCNDHRSTAIERDDVTGKPFRVIHSYRRDGRPDVVTRYAVADREAGAKRRLAAIMARYPGLSYYLQHDPRGCAVWLLRPGDVPAGAHLESYYTRGIPAES